MILVILVLLFTQYSQNQSCVELQVDLTEPILSRFDILCVVKDTVDPVQVKNLLLQKFRQELGHENHGLKKVLFGHLGQEHFAGGQETFHSHLLNWQGPTQVFC